MDNLSRLDHEFKASTSNLTRPYFRNTDEPVMMAQQQRVCPACTDSGFCPKYLSNQTQLIPQHQPEFQGYRHLKPQRSHSIMSDRQRQLRKTQFFFFCFLTNHQMGTSEGFQRERMGHLEVSEKVSRNVALGWGIVLSSQSQFWLS